MTGHRSVIKTLNIDSTSQQYSSVLHGGDILQPPASVRKRVLSSSVITVVVGSVVISLSELAITTTVWRIGLVFDLHHRILRHAVTHSVRYDRLVQVLYSKVLSIQCVRI